MIGAGVNGVGIVGVYPEARLQSWDAALGTGTQLATSDIVAGILAATNRRRRDQPEPGLGWVEIAIQQAIETAIRKGMLVVAAAGNDGDGSPDVPREPAARAHAAATDEQNHPTSFSSRSRFVDLAAPGQDVTVATALDDGWAAEAGRASLRRSSRSSGVGLDGAPSSTRVSSSR